MTDQILEQIPTPEKVFDRELKIASMSAAGRQFLSKSWEEIREKHYYELVTQVLGRTEWLHD